jgi:hypothetical protein
VDQSCIPGITATWCGVLFFLYIAEFNLLVCSLRIFDLCSQEKFVFNFLELLLSVLGIRSMDSSL